MASEWVVVAHDAVKIGVGSLITGGLAYLGVRTTMQSQRRNFEIERKTKMLEQVACDMEAFVTAATNYLELVDGIVYENQKAGDASRPPTKEQLESLMSLRREWEKQLPLRDKARAIASLLGERKVETSINEYFSHFAVVVDGLHLDERLPSTDEVIASGAEMNKVLRVYRTELSKAFNSLF
ncbi:hypothetical protein [Ferrimonas balearica]|uniref:hypothetical protein n=1 Tax=Ferrimonas balearica TaxID=44012 RepID=UPI001C93A7E0|nr:hypothetical protein [Ferrimonas balearica]MBY5981267.1 hypothetical protein [Ferrimonas balearica]